MLRHVVLLSFDADTSPEDIGSIVAALRRLPSAIPEIRSYEVGTDMDLAAGNADVVVVADFDDESSWRTYTDHPDHQRVIAELIRPHLVSRAATQHER